MPTLLRLDSSADLRHSRSREVTGAFAAAWAARGSGYTVVHRDLVKDPVPHIADSALHWAPDLRQPDEQPDPGAEAAQKQIIGELTGADVLLIGLPLYNYSLPSTVKAWVDQVHVPGVTAPFLGGDTQPCKGKKAVIAAAQGLSYDDGPQAGTDYSIPVLREVLGRALGMELIVLYSRYTLTSRVPQLADMKPKAEEEHAEALRQAEELAAALA